MGEIWRERYTERDLEERVIVREGDSREKMIRMKRWCIREREAER